MLGSKAKRELKINQRRILIDSIEIGIPSPQQIKSWGERALPNGQKVGEIKNSKTVNYKRFTPLKDGLFCERIFGPVNSFVCACGKRQPRLDWRFCDKCEVEYIDQRARRYRLGYISLVSPVAHIWYLKGRPSYVSLFLGKRKKKIVQLAYCNAYLVEQTFEEETETNKNAKGFAPFYALSANKQKEAHGNDLYKKQIMSSPAIEQFSNLFYNSTANFLDKRENIDFNFQKKKREFALDTNFIDHKASQKLNQVSYKKNKDKDNIFSLEKKEKGIKESNKKALVSSLINETKIDLQFSAFQRFQEKINCKTSPPTFFHLLAESLGNIKKTVVLTNMVYKKNRQIAKEKRIASSLSERTKIKFHKPFSIKRSVKSQESWGNKENLFTLQPLWGYKYSKQDTQDLRDLRDFNNLLYQAKSSFSGRQNKNSSLRNFSDELLVTLNSSRMLSYYFYYVQKHNYSFDKLGFYKFSSNFVTTVLPFSFLPPNSKIVNFNRNGPIINQTDKAFVQEPASSQSEKESRKFYGKRFNDFTFSIRENTLTNKKRFSTHSPDTIKNPWNLQRPHHDFYYNKNLNSILDGEVEKNVSSAITQQTLDAGLSKQVQKESLPVEHLNSLQSAQSPNLRRITQTPLRTFNLYNRAQTLPFLPDLICKYNLRDELLNFLNSSPWSVDRPIPWYCEIPRRQPLQDVHHFMSEQVLSEFDETKSNNTTSNNRFPRLENVDTLAWNRFGQAQFKKSEFLRQGPSRNESRVIEKTNTPRDKAFFASKQRNITKTNFSSIDTAASRIPNTNNVLDKNVTNSIPLKANTNKFSLFNASSFDVKHKKINGFALSNDAFKASDNPITKTSLSVLADNFLNRALMEDKEYNTLFEKLTSLRHILYMTLLQKNFSLRSAELTERISQMSALFATISRQKFIYNTINFSAQKIYYKNSARQRFSFKSLTLEDRLSVTLNQRSRVLQVSTVRQSPQRDQIQLYLKYGNSRFAKSPPFHLYNSNLQKSLTLSKETPVTRYSISKKNNLDFQTTEFLFCLQSRLFQVHQRHNLGFEIFKVAPFYHFQETPTLMAFMETLKFQSSEKLYRLVLLNKAWVRSFVLKKHLSRAESQPANRYKNRLLQQKQIDSYKQTQLVPSLAHVLKQYTKDKKQLNNYTLIIQEAWSFYEKNKKYDPKMFDVGRLSGLFWPRLTQQNFNVVDNMRKKSVRANEKRLINQVYNLNFVIASNNETLATSSLFQSSVQTDMKADKSNTSILEKNLLMQTYPGQTGFRYIDSIDSTQQNLISSEEIAQVDFQTGKRTVTLLANTLFKSTTFLKNTSIDKETRYTQALSFFLIPPYSQKRKQSVTERSTSQFSFLQIDKKNDLRHVKDHTGLQIQLNNGTSQLLYIPHTTKRIYNHHVYTPLKVKKMMPSALTTTLKLKPNEKSLESLEAKISPLFLTAFRTNFSMLKGPTAQSIQMQYEKEANLKQNYDPSKNGVSVFTNQMKPFISQSAKIFSKSLFPTVDSFKTLDPRSRVAESLPRRRELLQTRLQQRSFQPSSNAINTVVRQSNTLSPLDSTTIREILSYTGGGALQKLLQRFDTQLFAMFLFADIQLARAMYKKRVNKNTYPPSRVERRVLTKLCRRIYTNSRRLKIAQLLIRSKRRPEWMMVSILPVLPPDLRPILQMSESVVVASDLNNLYQRVIYRNNRFHKLSFIDFHLVTAIQRLVQDAVDRLIENGKGGSKAFYTPTGRPLKSLSDTLKGKKGRFRLNLLGKRVDFSGRSVIVVSPNLKIHECGLPREIALELYHYFLLRRFLLKKQASSIVMAKRMIKLRDPLVWDALRDVMYHHPVLLNRAPTLHRLGIQAFQPKLVQGSAILLHPLVCSGFNADFDGDQMGAHLPLSSQARAEAWDLLWSRNNLLSPATGMPVLVPSQDMVLGFYYITQCFCSRALLPQKYLPFNKKIENINKPSQDYNPEINTAFIPYNYKHLPKPSQRGRQLPGTFIFFDCFELLRAFQLKQVEIHTPVWLQWRGKVENDEGSYTPLELRVNSFGVSTQVYPQYKRRQDRKVSRPNTYMRTTAGRVLVHFVLFPEQQKKDFLD